MSISCPDCGAVAGYGQEIGHKSNCPSSRKGFDFSKLRTMTPEEVAAVPAEIPDPDYIRRNTEWNGAPVALGLHDNLRRIMRTCEMSAGIMRDTTRTAGWEGSEKTADQFDRIAERARESLEMLQDVATALADATDHAATMHAAKDILMEQAKAEPDRVTILEELFLAASPFAKHFDPWMERLSDDDRSSVYPVHTMGELRKLMAALDEAQHLLRHAGVIAPVSRT